MVSTRLAFVLSLVLSFSCLAKSQGLPQPASSSSEDQGLPLAEATSNSDGPVVTIFPQWSNTRFWLSGQANFIFQTHPPFHSPYSGKNSLSPRYEKATSRVITVYSGVRLNDSSELLVDIEEAGGSGLSNSLGLAGITNLDVVRIPGEGSPLSTNPYLARG